MKAELALLADSVVHAIRRWTASQSTGIQNTIFFGSIALIVFVVFAWAIVFRKQRHRHHRHHHHQKRRYPEPVMNKSDEPRRGIFFNRRKKRKRKERLRANPTLAETGGLPPPRDEPPTPSI
jgi:hypothetical protein